MTDVVTLSSEQLDALAAAIALRLRAEGERLLDRMQLAERIGISPRGVSGLAARGELPTGNLIGGVRRWEWQEVVKFLRARQGRRKRTRRGGRR